MNPAGRKTPLEQAAASQRLLGGLFVLLGGLPMFIALDFGFNLSAQLLSGTTTLVLIGPGVWYFLASKLLARGQIWVVRITQRIALAQMAAVVLVIAVGAVVHEMLIAPAIMAIYFIPALIAMIVELRKASRDPFIPQGHGFAVKVLDLAIAEVQMQPPSHRDAGECAEKKSA